MRQFLKRVAGGMASVWYVVTSVLRELVGWVLILFGLYLFVECYNLLADGRVIEVGPLSVIGIIVFRGGIHLLKVAVAARVALHARDRAAEQAQRPPRRVAGPRPAVPISLPAVRGS
jgi:hypothetical protein